MKNILNKAHFLLATSFVSFFLITTSVQAVGAYDLSAKKQKVESAQQDGIYNPNVEKTTEAYCYEVAVRNTSPLNETKLTLQYIVWVQNPDGKMVEAAKGEQQLMVPVGMPLKTKTKTFQIQSVEWDRRHAKDHKVESEIYGYAIRLLNPSDELVGEKFSADKIKALVDWDTLGVPTNPSKEIKSRPGKRGKKLQRNF